MRSRIDLPSRAFPTMGRAARRSAVLSVFLRTLAGNPPGEVIGDVDLGSILDDVEGSLSRSQLVSRPHVLRRMIAPVVLARPSTHRWSPEFRELVIAAFRDKPVDRRPRHFDDALACLRRWGRTRFAVAPQSATSHAVRAGLRLFDPEDLLQVEPSYIESENGIFTVSRHALVKAPLRALQEAINPVNWAMLGEFFEYVGQVGEIHDRKTDGWSGLFEERFVVGWGPLSLNSFHPILNVDFTVEDGTRVRADYALVYEEDDQLEYDDGYLEVKTLPGRIGWCEFFAQKRTRFRTPAANLIAPAILAVALESNLSSIEDAAYDRLDFLAAGDAP